MKNTEDFPLITIITPTYNSAHTLADTLESIAAQDYPHIEHIIVDGLSKDDTLAIAARFPHVSKIVSEKDKGIYDAMNKGVQMAQGAIIGILNSDDFYAHPQVLSQVVAKMQATEAEALYGDLVYVEPENTDKVVRYWKSGTYRNRLFYWGWMPPHPSFFVRRTVYERLGYFNLQLRQSADYELMLRFLLKNRVSVCYLPSLLVRMRNGGASSASWKNRLNANREDRKAWETNGLKPWFFTLWLKPVSKLRQFVAFGNG
jgi:glycosyltransferase